MCLIGFAWKVHRQWRLLLAGNRDEFHARPSLALARWHDLPITAGRDCEAGGTWLGVGEHGRCGVVTNVRDPSDPQRGSSRGLLVSDYLAGSVDASGHAQALLRAAGDYRPFNLLTFDADAAYYLGNRPHARAQRVAPGVHGLSNADFNTPWPKTRAVVQQLQGWIDAGHVSDFSGLFDALADERQAPAAELPATGLDPVRERLLSPAFIRGEHYGTRASTVVAIGHDGAGVIIERRFGTHGRFEGETTLRFSGPASG